MPSRKRPSAVLNGDADDPAKEADRVTDADDALSAAEEADAEAAEAEAVAAAARARARAIRLRREAAKATAAQAAATKVDPKVEQHDVESTAIEESATAELTEPSTAATDEPLTTSPDEAPPADDDRDTPEPEPAILEEDDDDLQPAAEPATWKVVTKAFVVSVALLGSIALLGLSGAMYWHHRGVEAQRAQSAEFAAAARQGVVTLMSLNFNTAKEDVQRIIDNTTGEFKKDFQGQSDAFIQVAQNSKVITEASVNAAAVQSMSADNATVLVAVTTNVSNKASDKQEPRSWRLKVGMTRDGDRMKLSKVEFVP